MEPIPLVRALFAAFERRDPERFLAVLDPACEFHAPTAELVRGGRPYLGHDGMRQYLADVDRFWDRLELEVDELRTDGEWVAALGRIRAHGGGRMVDSPVGWAWRVRDSRIVWGKVFESRRAALDLTGLHDIPPEPGQV